MQGVNRYVPEVNVTRAVLKRSSQLKFWVCGLYMHFSQRLVLTSHHLYQKFISCRFHESQLDVF